MADAPEREPGLERLDVLIGGWELEVILRIHLDAAENKGGLLAARLLPTVHRKLQPR